MIHALWGLGNLFAQDPVAVLLVGWILSVLARIIWAIIAIFRDTASAVFTAEALRWVEQRHERRARDRPKP